MYFERAVDLSSLCWLETSAILALVVLLWLHVLLWPKADDAFRLFDIKFSSHDVHYTRGFVY